MAASLRGLIPEWWRGERSGSARVLDLSLAPAEALFRGVVGMRNQAYRSGLLPSRAPPVPVISVGNLTVGGAGKTPMAAWIAALVRSWGCRPAIVLRGYAADEILVHQELNPDVPVHAARRRWHGAIEAARAGSNCVILDDGFQHRALRRDLDLVLVPAEQWTGNRRMLPRGPWREPVQALRRADGIVVTRKTTSLEEAERIAAEIQSLCSGTPGIAHLSSSRLLRLDAEPAAVEPLEWLRGRRVLAITTLADPRPVLTQLRDAGAVVDSLSFPDHHDFNSRDIASIVEQTVNRTLIMTRKEAVKLKGKLPGRMSALVLDLSVSIERGEAALIGALRKALRLP